MISVLCMSESLIQVAVTESTDNNPETHGLFAGWCRPQKGWWCCHAHSEPRSRRSQDKVIIQSYVHVVYLKVYHLERYQSVALIRLQTEFAKRLYNISLVSHTVLESKYASTFDGKRTKSEDPWPTSPSHASLGPCWSQHLISMIRWLNQPLLKKYDARQIGHHLPRWQRGENTKILLETTISLHMGRRLQSWCCVPRSTWSSFGSLKKKRNGRLSGCFSLRDPKKQQKQKTDFWNPEKMF